MIRVRSGWISREEAGLKAHDEVKRASSRINANASRVQYTPSCTTMCTERSRDPTTTGDDLVIRNNADAFSDNSSRINARQGSLPGIQLSFPSMPFAIALQNHSEPQRVILGVINRNLGWWDADFWVEVVAKSYMCIGEQVIGPGRKVELSRWLLLESFSTAPLCVCIYEKENFVTKKQQR